MRSVFPAALCVLLGCAHGPETAAEPAAPRVSPQTVETLSFVRTAPRVGEITEEIEERHLSLTLSDGERVEKLERIEERHTVLEVLTVRDGLSVRARVTYQRHRHRPPGDKLVVEGRAFVIERTAADLQVTDSTGKPVEGPVRAFVAKDFARFGIRSHLHALPASPLKVGERASSFEQAMRQELALRAPGQLEDLEVRLEAIRETSTGKAGVFVATFVSIDEARDVTMRLRAELVIRVNDGAILSSVITGPMEMGGPVKGVGTVRMVSEYSYR